MNKLAKNTDIRKFDSDWILAQYELGRSVTEIAAEMDKTEGYIYAQMRRVPEKYEDVKLIREEQHNRRLRRVCGLADEQVMGYLEDVSKDTERRDAEIDKINRIAKEYSHRVQLADGKLTENIGVNAKPFNVTVTKTYIKSETEIIEAKAVTNDDD